MRCTVTHFSPKAAASVKRGGVSPVRARSADAGKTIVVLFVDVCAVPRLHSSLFFATVTQYFSGMIHTSAAFYKSFV